MNPIQDPVLQQVDRWLREAVLALDLCPFAAQPYRQGLVQLQHSRAFDVPGALEEALIALGELLEMPPAQRSTTLLIFSNCFEDFYDFLEASNAFEEQLESASLLEFVQLASFHPDWRFGGEPEESLGHYSNRAPYPIWHLLRSDEVEEAIMRHPDTLQIPQDNIARLEGLGRAQIEALWARFEATEED